MPSDPKKKSPEKAAEKKIPCRAARVVAAQVVQDVLARNGAARSLLEKELDQSALPQRDRGLVFELALGTIRRARTIDILLSALCNRPLAELDSAALGAMRVAAYQLTELTRIPPHAVVHEAVEAQSHAGTRRFVNGVLRGLQRLLVEDLRGPKDSRPWGPDYLACVENTWRLAQPILPKDPILWLAASSGLPDRFVSGLVARYGFTKARELCEGMNSAPPLSLRVLLSRGSREDLLDQLNSAGFKARAGREPTAIQLLSPGISVAQLPGFNDGRFQVQDETAQGVAPYLDPKPGHKVLDLCAAPGGKATHLAELVGPKGQVIACDIKRSRLAKVQESAARLGLENIRCVPRDQLHLRPDFDRVLLDVPCSNTGVIRRRAELRHRLDELDWEALQKTQLEILRDGLACLAPGGLLAWSTCSIEPCENSDVLREHLPKTFEIIREQLTLPDARQDGGYVALIGQANAHSAKP